jgi:hypothetical protein
MLGFLLASVTLAACGHASSTAPSPGTPGAAWTLLGDTPAPRTGHAAVYDAARDRMLVFGGGANDLWAQPFSGPNANGWERIEAGGDMPPPIEGVPVIDEGKNRLLVFPSDSLERAWALPLDGSGEWSIVAFGAGPSIQLSFALAIDPASRRLYAYTSGVPEVWAVALDGTGTWQKVAGSPSVEGFSCRDTLVFDGGHGQLLVLSGGWPRGDVYALSLGASPAWTQLNKDQAWFDYGATTLWDAGARRFLITGPNADTWLWSFAVDDAAPAWTHLPVAGTPPGSRLQASGVYDSAHQRFVIFGGTDNASNLHNDTWAASLGDTPAWSQVGTVGASLPQPQGARLAFASDTATVVRFGGESTSPSLVFDKQAAQWSPLAGNAASLPLAAAAGAWDPKAHRLVAFGSNYTPQGQTWALDLATSAWTGIDGTGPTPGGRANHSMVYDGGGARLLVFGGVVGQYPSESFPSDVWALGAPGGAWAPIDVAGPAPAGREGHAAAFDDQARRMLVQGGDVAGAPLGDTWLLELTPSAHWRSVSPSGDGPPPLSGHFAAFDPGAGRFLVVGAVPGQSSNTADGVSVWALSIDPEPHWTRYCPKGTRPGSVDGAVWTDGALFVMSQGGAWRFDPSTPACD